jgi:uncharacterized membrane protein
MRVTRGSHAVLAATLVGLGIVGLASADFPPVWAPVPKAAPGREVLVYLCALVSLGSGLGLFWPRTAPAAARVLFVSFLLWWLWFRVPGPFRAPRSQDAWSGCAETAVMVAAAGALDAAFSGSARGRRGAQVLYGLALLVFGQAHFRYPRETASLVPGWLPAHLAWAYFTGAAFVAAGAAVLSGCLARLAAALSALELGLFTLLVWLPIVAAGSKDPYERSEAILSFALAGGAWVVADSYRPVSSAAGQAARSGPASGDRTAP